MTLLIGLFFIVGCETTNPPADRSSLAARVAQGEETAEPLSPYAKPTIPNGFDAGEEIGLWRLQSIGNDGRLVTIRVATSSCTHVDHVVATYDDNSIALTVHNEVWQPRQGYACTLPLYSSAYQVRLREAVGQRTITGECTPGDANPAQRQCETVRQTVESSP